jgi:hypothetical protein
MDEKTKKPAPVDCGRGAGFGCRLEVARRAVQQPGWLQAAGLRYFDLVCLVALDFRRDEPGGSGRR